MRRTALLFLLLASCSTNDPRGLSPVHSTQWQAASVCTDASPKLDLLLVIDDSASMSDEAPQVAELLQRFGQLYDESDLDYRVAVITTDVSSPDCPGARADARFVDQSCLQRLPSFEVEGSHEAEAADLRDVCRQHCDAEHVTTVPTTVEGDDEPRARPWLERRAGQTNTTTDPATYLGCVGQPGLSGCTAESPLAAVLRALDRSEDPNDPAYGFVRDDAVLAVLFIGDEDDCSRSPDATKALATDDETASAACWRTATACLDGTCDPADDPALLDLDAFETRLAAIEAAKQELAGDERPRVLVGAVAGVPLHYPEQAQEIGPGRDSAFTKAFGVGPGCDHAGRVGIPPVRIRDIAEAHPSDTLDLASSCGEAWESALPHGFTVHRGAPTPLCLDIEALDDGPVSTETLDESCIAVEHRNGESRRLPTCISVCDDIACERQTWDIPEGEDACVVWRSTEQTQAYCLEHGYGAEFAVARRDRLWEASCLDVSCQTTL